MDNSSHSSDFSNSNADEHMELDERNISNISTSLSSNETNISISITGSLTAELRRPLANNDDETFNDDIEHQSNDRTSTSDVTLNETHNNINESVNYGDDTMQRISSLEADSLQDGVHCSIVQGSPCENLAVHVDDDDMESEERNDTRCFSNEFDNTYDSSDEEELLEDNFNEVEENYFDKFADLIEALNTDDYNETITANLIVNKAEILLAILKYAATYSLPNSAIADLCKMINSFVDRNIIPDTRYRIDKLFYPDEGKQYHAVCPTCKTYVGQFDKSKRSIYCNVCEAQINLKDPSYRDFFVTLDVKHEIQDLIESNAEYYTSVICKGNNNVTEWTDIHERQCYKKFFNELPENKKDCYSTITFNSDGSPVFKSSKFSVWPIHIMVNEIPINVRNQNTIIYALWFGHDKPDMLYFLRSFVNNMNDLSDHGIRCKVNDEIKNIYVYAICCCVDSVARPPMQGTTQFNGYYGCNWCLHKGERVLHDIGSTIKYTLQDEMPQRRTAAETLQHMQRGVASGVSVFGVKKATPLINLNNFDIIDGFVPDSMHCIDLGVVKQFTEYWFNSSSNDYSISKQFIDIIDEQIKSFKVPTQLMRLTRSIKDRKYWKAKEWSNWLLYYSLPIFDQFSFFKSYAIHWSLLIEAYHLLLDETITELNLRRANGLLKDFVAYTEFYYGKDAMTFNLHQLLHLPQSVADWGPLWSHFGYPFESGNGKIVKNIHAAKGVLSQLCRNISFNQSLLLLHGHVAAKEYSPVIDYCYYLENRVTNKTARFGSLRYFGKPVQVNSIIFNQFNLSRNRTRAYKKLDKNKCTFMSCRKQLYRSNNSFARLKNLNFIQIEQFIVDLDRNLHLTVYRQVETENVIPNMERIKNVVQISQEVYAAETEQLDKLCIFMEINSKQYITAIPNMYWH